MAFELTCCDVLDSAADAVLLTIDGTGRNLFGNVAQGFQRRWPDDFNDLTRLIRYPLPIGRVQAIALDGECPFRIAIVASTLHHVGVLDETQKLAVSRTALFAGLELAHRHGATTLASAVLAGGWRLPAAVALRAMRETYSRFPHRSALSLLVCVREEAVFRELGSEGPQ